MRILAITGQSDRPETALLCGLAQRGHQVCVLGNPADQQKQALLSAGVVLEPFSANSRFDFQASLILQKKIVSWKPDLVHAFTGRTLAAAIRVKQKLGLSKNIHFHLATYRGTVGHLSQLDPASRLSFLSSKVDAISCVSNAVKLYMLTRKVPEEKLFTIYKGHDPKWYISESEISKAKLGLNPSTFAVMCVANARPVKGVDVFIDAANSLAENRNISFYIVGEIKDKNLMRRAKNLNLQFLGFRKDAQLLVAKCDLLVVPSRGREGLPKALLEALSLKKPVIASSVGGIPEVIRNEQDGLLIPPNDSSLLARTISFLTTNPDKCLELGQSGYNRLISDFNVGQMIDKTEGLYKSLGVNIKSRPLDTNVLL